MSSCHQCHRPVAREWRVCGWCGMDQAPQTPKAKLFAKIANMVLAFQAVALIGGTLALAILWAMRGWSVERGQTLGIIWLGVMVCLALMAWLSVNISPKSPAEQGPQPQAY